MDFPIFFHINRDNYRIDADLQTWSRADDYSGDSSKKITWYKKPTSSANRGALSRSAGEQEDYHLIPQTKYRLDYLLLNTLYFGKDPQPIVFMARDDEDDIPALHKRVWSTLHGKIIMSKGGSL